MTADPRPALHPASGRTRLVAAGVDVALVAVALAGVLAVNVVGRPPGAPRFALPGPPRLWVPVVGTVPVALLLGLGDALGGTPGRRVVHSRLLGYRGGAGCSAARPAVLACLLRSVLKTAAPWELGHQAVWSLRAGEDRLGAVCLVLAYGLVAAQVVAVLRRGDGRTYADRLTGTVVVSRR